jgi:hypothetical protein
MYMSCKERVLSHVLPKSMHQNKSLRWITPKVLYRHAATQKLERERERSWVKERKSFPLDRERRSWVKVRKSSLLPLIVL